MKSLIEDLRKKLPDYDSYHGLAFCDIVKHRIRNPINDIIRRKIKKENVIKILDFAFKAELIDKTFYAGSVRQIHSLGIPQVTR